MFENSSRTKETYSSHYVFIQNSCVSAIFRYILAYEQFCFPFSDDKLCGRRKIAKLLKKKKTILIEAKISASFLPKVQGKVAFKERERKKDSVQLAII